jgi:hypothetical protein
MKLLYLTCWIIVGPVYASLFTRDDTVSGVAMELIQEFRPVKLGERSAFVRRGNGGTITYGSFSISFSVGTPGQSLQAILDTSSADVLVRAPSAAGPDNSDFYNPYKSETYNPLPNSAFSTNVWSQVVSGVWMNETIHVSSVSLAEQPLGLAMSASMAQPVFGIGPKDLSICKGRCITVTEHFREAGLTQINGYSLYLDSLGQKSTGRVLFGAIDNKKYEGSLREIPLVNSSALMTNVTHLTVGSKIVAAGVNMTVLLDTGSTLCYFLRACHSVSQMSSMQHIIVTPACFLLTNIQIVLIWPSTLRFLGVRLYQSR